VTLAGGVNQLPERISTLSQTIQSLRRGIANHTLAERAMLNRSDQLHKLTSELTLAKPRERR
jgi:hypothetical protein